MARALNLLICIFVIYLFFGAHVTASSRIRKQTGTDLGTIGLNEMVLGNGTITAGSQVYMQITVVADCYARFTLAWNAETSLRSDLDFMVGNSDNNGIILGISERIPEISTFIMNSSRSDFGNGTFFIKVTPYALYTPSVNFTVLIETSSTTYCPLTDDRFENNQGPQLAPPIELGKTMQLTMCNDDWFIIDIPPDADDLLHVTEETSEPGTDPDFWITDDTFQSVFESTTQGNEEDIIVALTGSSRYYVMFFESNSTSNYTYTARIDYQEKAAKSKVGLIVGLAVGLGVFVLAAGVGGFFLFRRLRAGRYRKTVNQFVDSYDKPSTSSYDSVGLQSSASDTNYASITRKSQVERVDLQRSQGSSVLSKKSRDNYEIDYSELKIIKEIGKGSFGVVYKAQWRQTTVAVKQLKLTHMFEDVEKGLQDFRREAELLKSLRPHPNVVLFLGITTEPLSIVIEFCDGGSLVALLRDSSKAITFDMQVRILLGIARGMLHLHTENIIHRDLAARNILLGQDYIAKVSDFGLSRERRNSMQDKTQSTIGPLKVVWEVISRTDPFPTLDAVNAAMKVCYEGLRLPIPEDVSPSFASIMKACWELDPSARPDFEKICDELGKLEPKKTLMNPPKPSFLMESQSTESLISYGSSGSMSTTYTSVRNSAPKTEPVQ